MRARIAALAAMAAVLAATLTGCGAGAGSGAAAGGGAGCIASSGSTGSASVRPSDAASGVVYVVGAHRNAPAAALSARLYDGLTATIAAGGPVGVITVEGVPRVLQPAQVLPVDRRTDTGTQTSIEKDANSIAAAVCIAAAKTPGADLFTALQRAAGAAHAARVSHLVVLDSGLSDRGAVRFTDAGMRAMTGDQVAAFLIAHGDLARTDFAGLTVRFVGLADTTAPQHPLGEAQRRRTIDVWSAVVRAGGGRVVVDSTPQTGPAPATKLATEVTPVAAPDSFPGVSYPDSGSVGFAAGSAVLRDPRGAAATLRPVARWLVAHPAARVTVTGKTSSEPATGGLSDARLSTLRARAVVALLIRMGADAGQLQAVGAGYTASPPDTTAGGAIDPARAAMNRTVRITAG